MYKTSFYNQYIKIDNLNVWLLYNNTTSGFLELSRKEGELLYLWSELPNIPQKDIQGHWNYIKELVGKGFIVKEDLDETEKIRQYYLRRKKNQCLERMSKFQLNILPTFNCNMNCNYCYVKNKRGSVMSESTCKSLTKVLNKIISQYKPEERCKELSITWNGGEPTLTPNIIQRLSKDLIEFSKEYNLEYLPQMISNGILLDKSWHKILKECKIEIVQVTIDGGKETHNESRPLKNSNIDNYERILKNLSIIPPGITIMIRINADKKIFNDLEYLLEDLYSYKIWPHRSHQFDLSIYPKVNTESKDNNLYLNHDEFYKVKEEFRDKKVKLYNRWAKESGNALRKKKWIFPKIWNDDCQFTSFPLSFSIGADGYIFKCWEHANIPEYKIESIQEGLDLYNAKYSPWLEYDRFNSFEKCKKCKFIMLCHSAHCIKTTFDNFERPCSIVKYKLEESLRDQYIQSILNPEIMESISDYNKRKDLQL